MDLYEYQGKELLRQFGIETLEGTVAASPEEARAAAEQFGGTVAIKAQVLTGGRGKAGGIKVVHDPEEAEEAARQILGMDIKGHTVRQVLVGEDLRLYRDPVYEPGVLLDELREGVDIAPGGALDQPPLLDAHHASTRSVEAVETKRGWVSCRVAPVSPGQQTEALHRFPPSLALTADVRSERREGGSRSPPPVSVALDGLEHLT